jgi:hypothetical protein
MHGGGAPQVKRSAQQRLAALVDPALDNMARALKSQNMRAVVAAAKDILDRTVGRAVQPMRHSGSIAVQDEERQRTNELLKQATDDELREFEAINRQAAELYRRIQERAGVPAAPQSGT